MIKNKKTEELSYEYYQDRQYAEIQQDKLLERVAKIHFGNKFRMQNGQWSAIPYPGYAILSMVSDNPGNDNISLQLLELQRKIIKDTKLSHKLYPLPAESFHQTIANTLSDKHFYNNIINQGLALKYPDIISEAIKKIFNSENTEPIRMQLIGLSLFGSALGILGVFKQGFDYQRIIDFRSQFYTNTELNTIGIQRTRPFIGHITLLYFGEDINIDDGKKIANTCVELNELIKSSDLYFNIHHTQLRQYEHLAQFDFQPNFPIYSFTIQ